MEPVAALLAASKPKGGSEYLNGSKWRHSSLNHLTLGHSGYVKNKQFDCPQKSLHLSLRRSKKIGDAYNRSHLAPTSKWLFEKRLAWSR